MLCFQCMTVIGDIFFAFLETVPRKWNKAQNVEMCVQTLETFQTWRSIDSNRKALICFNVLKEVCSAHGWLYSCKGMLFDSLL